MGTFGFALCAVALVGRASAALQGVLTVRQVDWKPPGGGSKSCFLNGEVCSSFGCTYVGECGLEVIPLCADGLYGGDDGTMKPRAVLSGELFVQPSFRRRGVAQRLLREAENRVRMWGMSELILMVKCKNKAARQLYEKMGYRAEPHTKDHGNQLCMKRNLFTPDMHTLMALAPKHTVVDNGRPSRSRW